MTDESNEPKIYVSNIDIRIEDSRGDAYTTVIRINSRPGSVDIQGPVPPKIIRWLADLSIQVRNLNRGNGHTG